MRTIIYFCVAATIASCIADGSPVQKVNVTCGENLKITPEAGTRGDWGGTSTWEAAAHEDTLVLSRKGQCGDECGYEERIVLTSLTASCPSLVSATLTRTDSGSPVPTPQVKTATGGTLKIQDWKPVGGIVSGQLDSEIKLTFYAQVPTPPNATKPK